MSASAAAGRLLTPIFREAWPRHAAKLAARAAEVPHETARSWIQGRAVPSADRLLRMAARDEALAAALERRLHALREDRATALEGCDAAAPSATDQVIL